MAHFRLSGGSAPLVDGHLPLISVALVNAWTVVSVRDPGLSSGAAGHAAGDPAAAEVDGARPPQLLRYVILPLLRPTILVLGVLALVYAFKSFDYIYVMTFGGPGTASTTLPFLSYRLAFEIHRYSQGASVALITVAIVLLLALLYMRQVRREERA